MVQKGRKLYTKMTALAAKIIILITRKGMNIFGYMVNK